jgi:hypothetical protein
MSLPVRVADTLNEMQAQKMAGAVEKLAALNALPDITNPEAWQHEARQDRTLPGRES